MVEKPTEHELNSFRNKQAYKLAVHYGIYLDDSIKFMQKNNVFGNWDKWELSHRPVDLSELADLIWEEKP